MGRVKQVVRVLLAASVIGAIFWAGRASKDAPFDGVSSPVAPVSTATYEDLVRELEVPSGSLMDRVRDRGVLQSVDTVYVSEPAPPPDTVYRAVRVDGDGQLSTSRLIRTDSVRPLFKPQLLGGFDVRNCDDGYSLGPTGVVCDQPRFGHLFVLTHMGAGLDPMDPLLAPNTFGEVGIEWQKSYRSSWSLYSTVGVDGVWRTGVRWRWGLF